MDWHTLVINYILSFISIILRTSYKDYLLIGVGIHRKHFLDHTWDSRFDLLRLSIRYHCVRL